MVIFQIFKKQFLRIGHTLHGSFFLDFTPLDNLVIFFHKHQNNAYP
jgi:hypothetical protein